MPPAPSAVGVPTHFTCMTPPRAGAVAIIQLHGPDAIAIAAQLTGRDLPTDGRLVLRDLAGVDRGLVGVLRAVRDAVVQLMPHGGPRVVQKLCAKLGAAGARAADQPDAAAMFPEARSAIEADMLLAIAQAPSPAAIDLLAAQPALWRERVKAEQHNSRTAEHSDTASDVLLSCCFDVLLSPPQVALVGRPNVGKSTLTNTLLGRAVSIVSDLPGTTRDWVGSLAELGPPDRAVAVRWLDTPGLRGGGGRVEQRAIELARAVITRAEVLIAMRDPEHDWPALDDLPRRPDLWVLNKVDALDADPKPAVATAGSGGVIHGCDIDHPLPISALHDRGVTRLAQLVIDTLGLSDLTPRPWAFSPTLRPHAAGDKTDLRAYLGDAPA